MANDPFYEMPEMIIAILASSATLGVGRTSTNVSLDEISPKPMDIAVSQGIEGLEFVDPVNLETHVRIGKNGSAGSPAEVNDTIVLDPDSKEFDPHNMVFWGIGMR